MTKKFCDRCGCEIKSNRIALLRHRVHYAEVLFRLTDEEDFIHDLCPDCDDSLVAWFNHPELDDKPEGG